MQERLIIDDDFIKLSYEGFYYNSGGEDSIFFDDYIYEVEIDRVKEFLLKIINFTTEKEFKAQCLNYDVEILNHFREESRQNEIRRYL